MALAAFHSYAMAIEAAARAELGEVQAASLVATTALGAVENLQGCEYGLEIRLLCADVLERAGSLQAQETHRAAAAYAAMLAATIRHPRLKKLFQQRAILTSVSGALSGPPLSQQATSDDV
jgi:hypothetical protein